MKKQFTEPMAEKITLFKGVKNFDLIPSSSFIPAEEKDEMKTTSDWSPWK
ncbi:MAG: hypothetical protein MJ091_05070 [Clostridia bacterium]|nr:hypothetical protein [Clostridia bacterium]